MNIGQLCEMMYSLIEILKKKEKITADIFMQINPTKFKNNKKLKKVKGGKSALKAKKNISKKKIVEESKSKVFDIK